MKLSKPIPVLLTTRELNTGGIECDVTKIAIHLDRSRFEPHVACYRAGGIRYEELKRAGIPILHLPVTSLQRPSALGAAIRLRRYIREHGILLAHAYDASAVFVATLARAFGVPAVLSSLLGDRNLLDPRSRRQVRWTDKMVDTIVVNCEAMRRQLIHEEHVASERIELCYNGVDTARFHTTENSNHAKFPDASFVIGAVCVLRPEKALQLLQEAFARVRHLKPGMKLVTVGSGPELARLEANSRILGIEGDCIFVPATPSIPEYLRSFDLFVSSSISEAFSNTILEAMACGCAVVGSSVGGTPELIGNNERGLLFESRNAGDLAAKLATLINNEPLRREFGTRAAEFARRMLSVEIAARRMADIYERALRRKAALPFRSGQQVIPGERVRISASAEKSE
jgi:glycosyltransferase involved in cell wall biosynthesis